MTEHCSCRPVGRPGRWFLHVPADCQVALERIVTPHPAMRQRATSDERHRKHIEMLAASMQALGWIGLPILVHDRPDGRYQAWMGAHRLLAASDAGLAAIPVVVMSRSELSALHPELEPILENGASSSFDVQALLGKLEDQRPTVLMAAERENQPTRGF
jgi:hypothetical protein